MTDTQTAAELGPVPDGPAMARDHGRGMSAWNAYVAAQQAAREAATQCAGSPGDGTPEGDRAAFLLDSADLAWSQFEAAALAGPEAQ